MEYAKRRRASPSLIAQHTCDRCTHLRYSRKRASIQLGEHFLCTSCAIQVAKMRKAKNQRSFMQPGEIPMNRPLTGALTFIGSLPSQLNNEIHYPGEAQYISLMPGLGGEIWYDDGNFTGLTRLRLKQLLAQAPIASYATHFQGGDDASAFWFLLDRQNQTLFLGTQDAVSAHLLCNAQPRFPIWQAGEQTLWHEPYQC